MSAMEEGVSETKAFGLHNSKFRVTNYPEGGRWQRRVV